jgi:hypothetical protein
LFLFSSFPGVDLFCLLWPWACLPSCTFATAIWITDLCLSWSWFCLLSCSIASPLWITVPCLSLTCLLPAPVGLINSCYFDVVCIWVLPETCYIHSLTNSLTHDSDMV